VCSESPTGVSCQREILSNPLRVNFLSNPYGCAKTTSRRAFSIQQDSHGHRITQRSSDLHTNSNNEPYYPYQDPGNVSHALFEESASLEEHLRLTSDENGDIRWNQWLAAPENDDGESLGHIMHPNERNHSFDWSQSHHVQHLSHSFSTEQALSIPLDVGLHEDAGTELSNDFLNFIPNFHIPATLYSPTDSPFASNEPHLSLSSIVDPGDAPKIAGKEAIPRVSYSYSCPHCPDTFLDNARLQRHLNKHESASCTIPGCSKVFKANKELRRHIRNVHKQEPETKAMCGRSMRKDNIPRHQRTCQLCKSVKEPQM